MDNVRFRELTYQSADGVSTVHACVWEPTECAPRGVIQLAHGMCEYAERYDAWARRFAAAGFVFCGNDHLGHGKTAPDEAHLGYTAKRNGASYLVEDVHTLTVLMKKAYPALPVVLYGHSMGSFVARLYLTRYGEELAGALISGTAGAGGPARVARTLAHVIAAFRGDMHRSKLLTDLAFGSYNNKFGKGDSAAWLTRESDVRAAYRGDVFCSFRFTLAGYDTLFSLLAEVSRKKWANGVPKSLPVLLFSGDMDPVGNYGRGVREVYERMQRAGCNVRMKLYPDGRHEMHKETNRDEVFADLLNYLEEILA